MKVLIVDDEDDLREIIREQLRAWDVEVLEAKNGLECLWHVKHARPDVVLLDLNMPRLGGLEALKRIHTFDPRIAVIVLTASADPADHEAVRRFGAREVYTKPYDLEEIARVIVAQGGVPTVAAKGAQTAR